MKLVVMENVLALKTVNNANDIFEGYMSAHAINLPHLVLDVDMTKYVSPFYHLIKFNFFYLFVVGNEVSNNTIIS
jgi:hypothetical protein